MNFIAWKMLTGDRAKYLGLIFAIAFCTFLLENQTSIFASILKRTGSQILDVTDADVWVMDAKTEYFEQTKALNDTDLTRVRGVSGVEWAVKLFKGAPVARTRAGKFATCILLGLDDATLTGAPRKMLLGSWQHFPRSAGQRRVVEAEQNTGGELSRTSPGDGSSFEKLHGPFDTAHTAYPRQVGVVQRLGLLEIFGLRIHHPYIRI